MEQPIDPIGIVPLSCTTYNHLVVRYAIRASSASFEASMIGFSPAVTVTGVMSLLTGAAAGDHDDRHHEGR